MNSLLFCKEHENKIQRICLHQSCEHRVLCLLCEHQHGPSFQSIMTKQTESYKTFCSKINQVVDKYIISKHCTNSLQDTKADHTKKINLYFRLLKQNIEEYLQVMERKCLGMLVSQEEEDFRIIDRARVKNNYVEVERRIFDMLSQVYEGKSFDQFYSRQQKDREQELQTFIKTMHTNFSSIMKQHYPLRVKTPNFSVMSQDQPTKIVIQSNYQDFSQHQRFSAKLISANTDIIESIISCSMKIKNNLFIASYDKKLRVYNAHDLQLECQNQYNNILTKIASIAEDVYIIGQSKNVLVENITTNSKEIKCQRLLQLRGHQQKIQDLHSLNTRIIGSSCSQVVKIWDLYKEKCQFTLKQVSNPTCLRFLPYKNYLNVGFNDHSLRLYSIQTMKLLKKYQLPGLPLVIDEGKNNENLFYVGSFKSNIQLIDIRMNKIAESYDFKKDAVTCLQDSIYDSNCIVAGDRSGNVSWMDLRNGKMKVQWVGHEAKTNLSKPRGTVGVFEHGQNKWITVGCNDKLIKSWQVSLAQQSY